jgi:enoyl-[acyl-carrier-protein] reductase (NADH)
MSGGAKIEPGLSHESKILARGLERGSPAKPAAAEVGSLVYFLASDEAGAITGPVFSIDGCTLA